MKKVNRTDLLDGWLKYHNTNCKEVIAKYPEEIKEPTWFNLFPVTQEQHDEWVIWAKAYTKDVTKLSKKLIDKYWGFIYLDTSPTIKP